MVNQETLWTQYMNGLKNQVKLVAGEALQMITPNKLWNWGGKDPISGQFPYEEWMFLNVVPSDPLQNTNNGAAASQSGFDTAYQNWFNHLAIGDLSHDENYQKLQDALNMAEAGYQDIYQQAKVAWMNETSGKTPDFRTWLADPAQYAVNNRITEAKNNLDAEQVQLNEYRDRIISPIKAITDAYNNNAFQGNVSDPNSSKIYPVRLWSSDPVSPFRYVMDITNNNFGEDAVKGTRVALSFNSGSATYDYSKDYGKAGALWDEFVYVHVSGSYEKVQWSSFAEDYSINIEFQDLKQVTITPGQWFSGTNLTSYGKGPYSTGFSEYQSGTQNYFFGPGGAVSRVYKSLIVGYRPTITISAGSAFSSYLAEKWNANASIAIGPFYFSSGSYSSEYEKATVTTSDGKLTLKSADNWPLIVGVVSAWTREPK